MALRGHLYREPLRDIQGISSSNLPCTTVNGFRFVKRDQHSWYLPGGEVTKYRAVLVARARLYAKLTGSKP